MSTASIDRHVSLVLADGTVVDAAHPIPTTSGGSGSGSMMVQGADATGSTPTGAPVQIGIIDASGKVQPVLACAAGDTTPIPAYGLYTFASLALHNAVGNVLVFQRTALDTVNGLGGGTVGAMASLVYNAGVTTFYPLAGNTDGSLPVGGYTRMATATLTRPANTTTYTANTAIANATSGAAEITFNNCARLNGGSGMIHTAWLLDEALQSLKAQLELWIFDTAIGTVINDDAAWSPANADLAHLVGIVNFGSSPYTGSANCVYEATGLNLPFVCAAGTTSLHAQLVVRNAYVPLSAEVFQIRLGIGAD